MKSKTCPYCNRPMTEGEKVFEGFMARMLTGIAKKAARREVKWKVDFPENRQKIVTETLDDVVLAAEVKGTNEYARLSDLKFWGLLHQREEWFHQGIYQLSDLAVDFMMGKTMIPKRLFFRNGAVVDRSEEMTSYEAATKGYWNEIEDWIIQWRRGRGIEQMELFNGGV